MVPEGLVVRRGDNAWARAGPLRRLPHPGGNSSGDAVTESGDGDSGGGGSGAQSGPLVQLFALATPAERERQALEVARDPAHPLREAVAHFMLGAAGAAHSPPPLSPDLLLFTALALPEAQRAELGLPPRALRFPTPHALSLLNLNAPAGRRIVGFRVAEPRSSGGGGLAGSWSRIRIRSVPAGALPVADGGGGGGGGAAAAAVDETEVDLGADKTVVAMRMVGSTLAVLVALGRPQL